MSKILIIEDDPTSAHLLTTLLKKGGHEITAETTSKGAWKMLHSEICFDGIISDVNLADGDIRDLLQNIRQHPFLKKIPIIICSQTSDKQMVLRLIYLGIQDYMIKPYNRDKLMTSIKRSIEVEPWYMDYKESSAQVCDRLGYEPFELEEAYKNAKLSIEESCQKIKRELRAKHPEAAVQDADQICSATLNLGLKAYNEVALLLRECLVKNKMKKAEELVNFIEKMLENLPIMDSPETA